MRLLLVLLAAALFHSPAFAVETKDTTFDGKRYVVCLVDLKKESLELFLKDDAGAYFHHFENLERALASQKRRLVFGMNAGMFHPGFAPVGLFIDHGRLLNPLNLDRGEGNFFLMPNGVFAVTDAGALIAESSRFSPLATEARIKTVKLATQSGPLLVIDGKLHPAFRAGSESRLFRNGVGIISPTRVAFVISSEPVNFHEFARLFRDELRCRDALFLDGTLSALHSAELKRSDKPFPLGPIIGVTAEAR